MRDKVVIITGASSGIGKALAFEMAAMNAVVVIAARSEDKLAEIESALKADGKRVLAVRTDVTQEADCKDLIGKTVAAFGRVDVLINNAGISMRALFEQADLKVIRELMEVNFWGTVYCTKYALPYLLQSKGSLVGVSSIAGFKGLPGRTGYTASKFAMQGLLETIRIETMKRGLHVLIACPAFTASNIRKTALAADGSPQGESPRNEDSLMKAEDVARKIIIAIKKRRRILVISPRGKLIVILNKLFPFFMDRMVYNDMAKEPDSPFK
jgi:dehydrogenase/reductase SDR family member 7B